MPVSALTSPDQLLAGIAALAGDLIAANAGAIDREARFPTENVAALGRTGALGLMVPPTQGGAGGSLADLAEACATIGAACASTGMVFLMHNVAVTTLAASGGKFADELLRRSASGELLATLAFSERGTGAHFYAPELRATRRSGTMHVSGRKAFVTAAGHADVMLVLVQGAQQGPSCYAVEREAVGIRFAGEWNGLGLRGNGSIAVDFDEVALPDAALVGEEGAATEIVFEILAPTFLAGLSGINLGIGEAALAAAVGHVRSRAYGDGTGLAAVPSVQHGLASVDIDLRCARSFLTQATRSGGKEDALVALMEAKIRCTETAARVTGQCLELCGGQGYTTALSIERYLRDAQAGAVMAPTNGVLRTWVGKALLGLPVP
jgi:alkylation response protein AidB-like acyl-CoA dehydrogenase